MRDDAVLRRALPLGRGLGRMMEWTCTTIFWKQQKVKSQSIPMSWHEKPVELPRNHIFATKQMLFSTTYLNDISIATQQIEDMLAVKLCGFHAINHQHT